MSYDIPVICLNIQSEFYKEKKLSTHHCIHVSFYLNYSSTAAGIVWKLYMYMNIFICSEINCFIVYPRFDSLFPKIWKEVILIGK